MARNLFLIATTLFWGAMFAAWAASTQPASPPPPAGKVFTPAELARHARPDDCWMAIGGDVHDLTAYLPDHPSNPKLIEPWCGREATEAYRTKTRGRPHSPQADQLLPKYRIGRLGKG